MSGRAVDCHAHIIDPARFPFADGPGYRPKPEESGPVEAFVEVLDANGISNALLVQPSGYGVDNTAIFDAMRRCPGRFRAIVVVDPSITDAGLAGMREAGAIGVRFNLVSYDRHALDGADGARFLDRLKAHGLHAQVFADDDQWPDVAATFRRHHTGLVIDHFGVRNIAAGVGQPGFQAVLGLGRDGLAAVKLSAPFRVSRAGPPYADLDPFAAALVEAFGTGQCVFGSDWPFIGIDQAVTYPETLEALRRWLPDAGDREEVLWRTPAGLFGFGEEP